MLLLFGGEKGGTGKSTLATNVAVALALAGKDVLLVDTDKQGSAAAWAATRSAKPLPPVHCFEKFGSVEDALRDAVKRYEHVVVDAGGRDSRELRAAMVVANRMYIPIKASQFDLWTIARMEELVGTARGFNPGLLAWALISMAPTNPQINEAAEAQQMLQDFEQLRLATTIIRERKVYRDAIAEGQGVLELDNEKAIAEIQTLTTEIFGEQVQPVTATA